MIFVTAVLFLSTKGARSTSVCSSLRRVVVCQEMRHLFIGLLLTCVVFSANVNDFAGRRFWLRRALTAATTEDASTAAFSDDNANSNPSALPGRTSSAPARGTNTASFPTKREEKAADWHRTFRTSKTAKKERLSVGVRGRSEGRSLRYDDDFEEGAPASTTSALFASALLKPLLLVLAGLPCSLSERTLEEHLNETTRTWRISRSLLDDVDNDIQVIVNCTKPGDVLTFSPERIIGPSSRIVIPWSLTLTAHVSSSALEGGVFPRSDEKAVFTCLGRGEGVFLVK